MLTRLLAPGAVHLGALLLTLLLVAATVQRLSLPLSMAVLLVGLAVPLISRTGPRQVGAQCSAERTLPCAES